LLALDGRQVYYDAYHKSNENTDKIKINMLQPLSL